MAAWRFYQGLRGEWRWYALDEAGQVINSSDQGFLELSACMLNAGYTGFAGGPYQVHARAPTREPATAPVRQAAPEPSATGGAGQSAAEGPSAAL